MCIHYDIVRTELLKSSNKYIGAAHIFISAE